MTTPDRPVTLDEALRETARLMAEYQGRLGWASVSPRKIRDFARQACFGDLWKPETRFTDVPEDELRRMRTLARQVINRVCPGGAYARGCSADDVLAVAEEANS